VWQWVLRRKNGYFVDSTEKHQGDPFIYRVGDTRKVIKGFDEAVIGMKQGGVRRMLIPPEVEHHMRMQA
jgi:FKBP-type peptidyl-prolyl cis-trans isomerase